MAKGPGLIHQDVFNEVDNTDPNKPDTSGEGMYFGGWPEIMKNHLAESGNMIETPNTKASRGLYGSTVKGEPNALERGGKGGD